MLLLLVPSEVNQFYFDHFQVILSTFDSQCANPTKDEEGNQIALITTQTKQLDPPENFSKNHPKGI